MENHKSGTAYVDKETGRRTIIINANDPKIVIEQN